MQMLRRSFRATRRRGDWPRVGVTDGEMREGTSQWQKLRERVVGTGSNRQDRHCPQDRCFEFVGVGQTRQCRLVMIVKLSGRCFQRLFDAPKYVMDSGEFVDAEVLGSGGSLAGPASALLPPRGGSSLGGHRSIPLDSLVKRHSQGPTPSRSPDSRRPSRGEE